MGSLTHSAARAAASVGIDVILKKVNKDDREAEIIKLIDLMEKYMDGVELGVNYDSIRTMIADKNGALNKYINRVLDEVDPNVIKTTVLNFGFEAMLHGTKTIRKCEKFISAIFHG